jgi:hypothetical protein
MLSNYLFILLLAGLWLLSFVMPTRKLRKSRKRLLWLVRLSFSWWVIGMSYHLLGFLIPNMIVPRILDDVLKVTLALPCRLGIGFEQFRTTALSLPRFDLAWAMIWGLPLAFLCSILLAALQKQIKTRVPSLHRSFRE